MRYVNYASFGLQGKNHELAVETIQFFVQNALAFGTNVDWKN